MRLVDGGRFLTETPGRHSVAGRTGRGTETSTAIRADIVKFCFYAIRAESTFIATNACLGAGHRRTDPACQGWQHERGAKKPAILSCDALAENESARQVMGESILRVIAHELVVSIKDSVSVDWMHRETARARMRVW
jgi:hypothetical protein